MKFPLLFLNHGGGPMPLLGRQPSIANHIQSVRKLYLPKAHLPKLIVVISAHWEADPVRISSSPNPRMYFDYQGFPPDSYEYSYPAPGSPVFAQKIQKLLDAAGIPSRLDEKRGFDHGVFIPLMLLYPEANIPVVCVSMHGSLDAKANIELGRALSPLLNDENDDVLMLGSGYAFHNLHAVFHPSNSTYKASVQFDEWLKDALLRVDDSNHDNNNNNNNNNNKSSTKNQAMSSSSYIDNLVEWEKAPGARQCHPRAEHFMPLLVVAGAAFESSSRNVPQLIYDTSSSSNDDHDFVASSSFSDKKMEELLDRHVVSGYLFGDASMYNDVHVVSEQESRP
jgi:4,5-DOPA dioxygenase extradiol